MKILLTGATGFIGRSLLVELQKENHQIFALVRKKNTKISSSIKQITIEVLDDLDEVFDVFINLAGENIASKPWSKQRKAILFDSRIGLTNQIRQKLKYPPKRVVSMSAVGFYGVTKNGVFDERTAPQQGFSHDLCKAWEGAAECFSNEQTEVVIFRLGVVLGLGGALEKMRMPFLCFMGGPIAGGKQWFPWVHIDDVMRAIIGATSDYDFKGTYNLVAPQCINQETFTTSYGVSLKRPTFLPTPKWLLRLLLGEMACLLTEGPQIVPKRLEQKGFEFKFNKIDLALMDIEERYQAR